MSKDQFYAAAQILAAHLSDKGLYQSATASKNQLRWEIANAGLTRSMMLYASVLKAGTSLALGMNPTCDNYKDPRQSEDILMEYFRSQ